MENTYGRLQFLTHEQRQTLSEFKEALAASGSTFVEDDISDHHLLRFLRARNFNIPNSVEMWMKYEKWKIEFGTKTILDDFDFPEYQKVREAYPRIYHKTDRIGRPIYIERVGKANIHELWQNTTHERMLRNHVYEYEKLVHYRLEACSIKSARHHEQSCTILDLDGIALSQFNSVYNLISQVTSVAQDYYPEMLGLMYIINAPMLFTAVWTVCKQLMNAETVRKIQILGSNYKSTLLQTIDADNLPDFLGGTCKCPGGCENADIGPWNDGTVPDYPIAKYEKVKF